MKLMLALIVALSLSGCLYQAVNKTDILKAEFYCKDKGGIRVINAHFVGNEVVHCVSGDVETLGNVTLDLSNED